MPEIRGPGAGLADPPGPEMGCAWWMPTAEPPLYIKSGTFVLNEAHVQVQEAGWHSQRRNIHLDVVEKVQVLGFMRGHRQRVRARVG